jgi:hypothetical protein
MMLEETKLYRCDLPNKAPLLEGHTYDIKNNGNKCMVDPTAPADAMDCPWSRWADEIMSQLVSAKPAGTMPCPRNPYAAAAGEAAGQCHKYVDGAGTDYVTEFWLTTAGVPVKENQQLKGKQGFTVTTYYSGWKAGEPHPALFAVPSSCKKKEEASTTTDEPTMQHSGHNKAEMLQRLRQAMRARRLQRNN